MNRVDVVLTAAMLVMVSAIGALGYQFRPVEQEVHEASLLAFNDAREDQRLALQDLDGDDLADILENRLSSTDLLRDDSDGDGMPDAWEFEMGLNPNDPTDLDKDPDADGLSNGQELLQSIDRVGLRDGIRGLIRAGLDPLNPDTDGDGMPDGWEVRAGLDPLDPADADRDLDGDGLTNLREYQVGSDPRLVDTDRDGLSDFLEVEVYGTDPTSIDSDRDGLPDAWEISVGLDPSDAGDRFGDPDGDGLDNSQEYQARTHPRMADSDMDGLPDAWELLFGLDPLNGDDATQDPDADGLTNRQEYEMLFSVYARSTEPLNPDTDGDGLDDGAEMLAGSSPFAADTDGDGLSDFEEVRIYGTDPTRADTDQDGLLDAEEIRVWGTNPKEPDSDHDQIKDGDEVAFWQQRLEAAVAALNQGQDTPPWLRELHPSLTPAGIAQLHGPLGDLDGDGRPNLLDADSDGDGLFDGMEVRIHQTDPAHPDTDGDRMPDGWEVRYGLDPLDPKDADEDPDQDGILVLRSSRVPGSIVVTPATFDIRPWDTERWDIVAERRNFTNLQEFEAGTHPTNRDSDCDGLLDGWELYFSITDTETGLLVPDPTVADSHLDRDRDGEREHAERSAGGDFTAFEEWWYFTNPNAPDTDGDGLPDGYEVWLSTSDPATNDPGEWGLPGNGLAQVEALTLGCVPL